MKSAVGLSIRSNWVEVLEAQRGFQQTAKVTKFGRFPLASSDKAKVVEAIKGALDAAKIKTKEVVLAIPTQEVILRYFTLPFIPKHEWAGAVQFEARKYIPFKLEELVWDFHVTERKQQRQLDIIFVAARKEVFVEYMALLAQAGLKAVAVEAASFSLARALLYARPQVKEATFAAIDVSGDTAHVAFVHQGIPQLARDVFLAGPCDLKPLETLIAPAALPPAAVTADEAAVQGEIPALPAPSEQEAQFNNLLSELKLSLDYFSREFSGQEIRQVVLCGEQAVDQWRDWLAQELKLSVELAHSDGVEGLKGLPSAWTLALGLALHGISTAGPRVNFMRHETQGSPVPLHLTASSAALRPAIWEVALVGLLFVVLSMTKSSELRELQGEILKVREVRMHTALPVRAETREQLQALKHQMDEQLGLLRATVGGDLFLTPKLAAIPRLLPETVWLETLRFRSALSAENNALQLTGVMQGVCLMEEKAREIELVNQLPERLRRHPGFAVGVSAIRLASVGSRKLPETDVTNFELEVNPIGDRGGSHAR